MISLSGPALPPPLRITTPKLIWIAENCTIDEGLLGVLIPNSGRKFKCMLMQKINDYTEISQK